MSTFSDIGPESYGYEPIGGAGYLEAQIDKNFKDIVTHATVNLPHAAEDFDYAERQKAVTMAKAYAEILCGPHAPDEAEMTAYDALLLAKIVGDYCIGEVFPLPYGRYFADPAQLEMQRDEMQAEERAYMGPGSAMAVLTDECMNQLDPTKRYSDVARTVAAVAFKSIEEAFVARSVARLSTELDARYGEPKE